MLDSIGTAVAAFPANAKFGAPANPLSLGFIAYSLAGFPGFTAFTDADPYFLFEFTGGNLPQNIYGWGQLSVNFGTNGPDVTVSRFCL